MTSNPPDTTTTNPAIWVTSTAALEPPPPAPGPGETLVRVAYSGINPADVKLGRHLGIRDTVAGYDYSGTVVRAGAGSKFAAGDRIAGCTPCSMGRPPHFGTHQDHVLAPDAMVWRVPDENDDGSSRLPLDHAACLAVSARTAADAVFNLLRYPLPADDDAVLPSPGPAGGHDAINREKEEKERDQKENDLPALLVWGGGSSLGFMAIQFARAAGARRIFATASPAHHGALRELGATACFDYRDGDVVARVRGEAAAATGGVGITRVFDAVGDAAQGTAEKAFACAGSAAGEDVDDVIRVCSTAHPGALVPLATLELPFSFSPPGAGGEVVTVPPRPEGAARVVRALEWAVRGYGKAFRIPTVEVVEGRPVAELVRYLEERCEAGARFRKVCLKHPFWE
ncbi:hypothetical protein SLS58_009878 [Diplodia intermedia]|uniref:Enoyl reductase (ER) domain-containing protein n=1 Tax=Diplodia intermedia TaxID=856260 RepID=A0ABR3T9F8_9PEZI